MPTIKPRLNLTLEPEEYEVLKRLSVLSNTSMAKVLREYISVIMPQLAKVVESLEAIQDADAETKQELGKLADDALGRLESLNHYAQGEYVIFNSAIDELTKKDKSDESGS